MKHLLPILCLFVLSCNNSDSDGEISGCTYDFACNYDENATVDDGSCIELECAGECSRDSVICGKWKVVEAKYYESSQSGECEGNSYNITYPFIGEKYNEFRNFLDEYIYNIPSLEGECVENNSNYLELEREASIYLIMNEDNSYHEIITDYWNSYDEDFYDDEEGCCLVANTVNNASLIYLFNGYWNIIDEETLLMEIDDEYKFWWNGIYLSENECVDDTYYNNHQGCRMENPYNDFNVVLDYTLSDDNLIIYDIYEKNDYYGDPVKNCVKFIAKRIENIPDINGCIDSNSNNFNPYASNEDGSCDEGICFSDDRNFKTFPISNFLIK